MRETNPDCWFNSLPNDYNRHQCEFKCCLARGLDALYSCNPHQHNSTLNYSSVYFSLPHIVSVSELKCANLPLILCLGQKMYLESCGSTISQSATIRL